MALQEEQYSDFFGSMEEYGFFEHIEHSLPDEFTSVYEIARVLEDKDNPLTQRLAPILWQKADISKQDTQEREVIPNLPYSEEYEAGLMRSHRDIVNIYPHQFLLPEEVFYQKLAERSLWMPQPKAPRNYRYQAESDVYAPDSRKQKVYVLLDTSSSMIAHHRIHLAKAIAYIFLRENMKELGTIFFRTFDIVIGDLHIAKDKRSFEKLISAVMHIDSLGNGTMMSKAIQTAVEDIHSYDTMSEAQILIITDGAVHLEKDKIQAWLGNTITLNTIKIGHDAVVPPKQFIDDQIFLGNSDTSRLLQKLHEREKDVKRRMSSSAGDQRKHHLEEELAGLHKQIGAATEKLSYKIAETYGREITELSSLYIEVDDIDPGTFALPEARIREVEDLTQEMIETLSEHADAEEVKKAALLYNHITFLLQYNPENKERLEKTAEELRKLLEMYMDEEEQAKGDHPVHFNMMDQKQISLMMKSLSPNSSLSLATLLRHWYRQLKRALAMWRQKLRYKK